MPTLGLRLLKTRSSKSQPERAAELGVHKNTYARWERDEAEIGAEALTRIVGEGWNVNWLLTGEGPELLESLAVAEDGAGYASHAVQLDRLTLALQLVAEALDEADRELPPDKHAKVVLLACDLLEEGMPRAKVLHFVLAAAA